MSLRNKRSDLIKHIKDHKDYLNQNKQALDIYDGNLFPYVDAILQATLSPQYYETIRHRSLPINILQRFIDKISTVYTNPPKREGEDESTQAFVDFYVDEFDMDQTMLQADQYSNLFKSYALEPYINIKGEPAVRVLSSDSFLVYSDSAVNPEEETIFLKFMGCNENEPDSMLVFAYSNEEFDAFYLNNKDAPEYLSENKGVNLIGRIPYIYGKRQKNRLIPVLDSDMLRITKAIPSMLTDASGAQMYQAFSIIYMVDCMLDNPKMSPNIVWNLKSDRESDKTPTIGQITPVAKTQEIMEFITNVFILWLETKGIRVGSVGAVNNSSMASGISKIIEELDAYLIIKKSAMWFEEDEEEFWKDLMPKMHNYWIKSGQIGGQEYPGLVADELEVDIHFEKPKPMVSKTEQLANVKAELDMGTMTLKQALEELHPNYSEEQINEVLNAKEIDNQTAANNTNVNGFGGEGVTGEGDN